MCNLFFAKHQSEKFQERWSTRRIAVTYDGPIEIYPGYITTVIRTSPVDGVREQDAAFWGLVPGWVKQEDFKAFSKPNNARDDTIAKALAERKGMFYEPMRNGRCILPATAWCEWTGEKGKKVCHQLGVKGESLFALAGLTAYRKEGPGLSCTMITTAASVSASPYHHRMPVVLRDEDVDRWLDPASDPKALLELLAPLPDELLVVSPP